MTIAVVIDLSMQAVVALPVILSLMVVDLLVANTFCYNEFH